VKRLAGIVALVVVGVVAPVVFRSARADVPAVPPPLEDSAESMPPAPSPPAPERRWYGWQILAADVAASLAWVGAAKSGSPPLVVLGELIYVGGGPAIHAQHSHRAAVVPSLIARLVAPVVGVMEVVLVETVICSPGPDGGYFYSSCQREGAVAALLAPMLVTSIVDIAFAWTPVRDAPPANDLAWLPTLSPTTAGKGAALGIVGRF
jgi:hypothetical protein